MGTEFFISALVPEIFKFEKCVKYVNEMTDDVIFSTQYNIKYINRAISVNLQQRPLKPGRLIVLKAIHLRLYICHQTLKYQGGLEPSLLP